MTNFSKQRNVLLMKLRWEANRLWQALTAIAKKWLTDPQPLVDDLPWWAPQRRRACAITLGILAIVLAANWLFIRSLDAGYDSPKVFEQVYYLNDSFTFAQDTVTIHTNIFGVNGDPQLPTRAELRRVLTKDGSAKIEEINGKYVEISTVTVRPEKTAIKIAALTGERNLRAALEKMAEAGLVRVTPASKGAGAVYSFDLEMEVFRGNHSIGTFTETFHLRADALVEHTVIGLMLALAFVAIVFVSDFTFVVLDYRWRQYFKAVAVALAEVLHYLKYAADIARQFPDTPLATNETLIKLLKEIVDQIITQLERLIAKSDDQEAKELRDKALALLNDITEHAELPMQTEADLSDWKKSLEGIIARTEQLQQRTLHLSQRKFRYFKFKAPITRESLRRAVSEANKTVLAGFNRLTETIGQINLRRSEKRKTHEKARELRIDAIAHLLDEYLDGDAIKQAMEKLGEPFPLNVDPEDLFKLRPIYTRGEFEYIDGEQRLVYPNFYFAVKTSETRGDDPIWFMIRKAGEDYVVAQADTDSKRNITSGTVTLPALNPQDNEVEVRYTIKVTPEKAAASKRTRDFKITPSDVKLITPDPTPEPWFEEVPTPEEPKEVKLK